VHTLGQYLWDAYDAATIMCITPLSEISIASGGMPVKIPNFKEKTAEVKANE
jgi:hypothetical protein